MKLNKTKIILLSVLAIFIATFIIYILIRPYTITNIPADENLQVLVLQEIYRDFLYSQGLGDGTITIDDSALTNLVTNEKFSQSSIEELEYFTKKYKGKNKKYVLSSVYSNGILKLKISEQSDGLSNFDLYECTSTFKLINDDGKLSYIKKGENKITYRESPIRDVWN